MKSNSVKINMDGKSRRADNISIERWFRTLKYEEIYLKDYESPNEARSEIGKFIRDYNFTQIHSALGTTPAYSYYPAQLYSMLTATVSAILDRTALSRWEKTADGNNLKTRITQSRRRNSDYSGFAPPCQGRYAVAASRRFDALPPALI